MSNFVKYNMSKGGIGIINADYIVCTSYWGEGNYSIELRNGRSIVVDQYDYDKIINKLIKESK